MSVVASTNVQAGPVETNFSVEIDEKPIIESQIDNKDISYAAEEISDVGRSASKFQHQIMHTHDRVMANRVADAPITASVNGDTVKVTGNIMSGSLMASSGLMALAFTNPSLLSAYTGGMIDKNLSELVVERVKDAAKSILDMGKTSVKQLMELMNQSFKRIKKRGKGLFKGIKKSFKSMAQGGMKSMKSLANTLKDSVKSLGLMIKSLAQGDVKGAFEHLFDIQRSMIDHIGNNMKIMTDVAKTNVGVATDLVADEAAFAVGQATGNVENLTGINMKPVERFSDKAIDGFRKASDVTMDTASTLTDETVKMMDKGSDFVLDKTLDASEHAWDHYEDVLGAPIYTPAAVTHAATKAATQTAKTAAPIAAEATKDIANASIEGAEVIAESSPVTVEVKVSVDE